MVYLMPLYSMGHVGLKLETEQCPEAHHNEACKLEHPCSRQQQEAIEERIGTGIAGVIYAAI